VLKKGIIGRIKVGSKSEKCFIPANRTNEHEKLLNGEQSLKDIYSVGHTLDKVRIEWPSKLSRFYLAAIDR